EVGRLFPSESAGKPAVAVNHRGPSDFSTRGQFMLKAISKTRARTTTAMTTVPPRPDTLRAISTSISRPVRSDVSSDMDLSLQGLASRYANAEGNYARGGPRQERGADGGAIGACAASGTRPKTIDGTREPSKTQLNAEGGSFHRPDRAPAARAKPAS